MRFQTIHPTPALQREVECFIITENETDLPYTVLPDTALVLGFQYKGRLSLINSSVEVKLSASGITGLQNNFRTFKNTGPTGSILVRFKPGGTASLFTLPIHELFEQSVPLDTLVGNQLIAQIEEQLSEVDTDTERIQIIETFLLSIRRKFDVDVVVNEAIELIRQSNGNIRITELAKHLNTSASPLEKRFRSVVGCSPKKYAAIVRFRNVLKTGDKTTEPADRAYAAGYFDQAHFIKDFKRFTGQTPEDFFSARSLS